MENQSTKLQIGDAQKIADATGYSYQMVVAVMKGRRKNNTIQEAANKLITENALALKSIHNPTPKEIKEKTSSIIKDIATKTGYTAQHVRFVLIHKKAKNKDIEAAAQELGFIETPVNEDRKRAASITHENKYLWAKIAEMEQKQLKYLIAITEPYNQTPAI